MQEYEIAENNTYRVAELAFTTPAIGAIFASQVVATPDIQPYGAIIGGLESSLIAGITKNSEELSACMGSLLPMGIGGLEMSNSFQALGLNTAMADVVATIAPADFSVLAGLGGLELRLVTGLTPNFEELVASIISPLAMGIGGLEMLNSVQSLGLNTAMADVVVAMDSRIVTETLVRDSGLTDSHKTIFAEIEQMRLANEALVRDSFMTDNHNMLFAEATQMRLASGFSILERQDKHLMATIKSFTRGSRKAGVSPVNKDTSLETNLVLFVKPVHTQLGYSITLTIKPSHTPLDYTLKELIGDIELFFKHRRYANCIDRVHTLLHGYLRIVCIENNISFVEKDETRHLFKKITGLITMLEYSEYILHTENFLHHFDGIRNRKSLVHPSKDLLNPLVAEDFIQKAILLITFLEKVVRI